MSAHARPPTDPPTDPPGDQPTGPPPLAIRDVGHDHGSLAALDTVTLDVGAGSFVAVVGPSGCGKSTLLRLLAGLDTPTRGRILVGASVPAEVRRARLVGWLAQRPALLDWKTVHDNVALARAIGRPSQPHRRPHLDPGSGRGHEVPALLELVGLGDFGGAYPHQLSGGMQQRAALARTLAQDAPLWLMDEPLAALDELTRDALAADLLGIWQQLRPTVVWVTHHLTEAATLADRVVVLSPRPARVVGDLAVDLPRPRDPTDPRVQEVVRRARGFLAGAASAPAVGDARAGTSLLDEVAS